MTIDNMLGQAREVLDSQYPMESPLFAWSVGVIDRFNWVDRKKPISETESYIRGWCEMDDAIKSKN
jgi:hypothetical protein